MIISKKHHRVFTHTVDQTYVYSGDELSVSYEGSEVSYFDKINPFEGRFKSYVNTSYNDVETKKLIIVHQSIFEMEFKLENEEKDAADVKAYYEENFKSVIAFIKYNTPVSYELLPIVKYHFSLAKDSLRKKGFYSDEITGNQI